MNTTAIPTSADAWVGKTNRIAATLFPKVQRIHNNPHLDRLDRSWLFVGPPGVGKSSLAEALAHQLAGHPLAIDHRNGRSTGVDDVKAWYIATRGRPLFGQVHVFLIDELDSASIPACDELRTFLDKLPPYTVFIGTSNKKYHELPEQLHSRFQVWYFDSIPATLITDLLVRSYGIAHEIARAIAIGVDGNVRAAFADAKTHLDTMEVAA